jgi:hypothetical protein
MEEAQQHPAVRQDEIRARRRPRGFGLHLAGCFFVMAVLVTATLIAAPENPWFVWPGVGWGGIRAGHAAYAMELFDSMGR